MPTQFEERKQQAILAEMRQNPIISPQTSLLCWMTSLETIIIQYRIKFCIQHTLANEYQEKILESIDNCS